jgi:transcriptional regulator with XRE-family HTH domain
MENDGEGEARWPIDLEARVAKNVRRLREGRGISQHQLGADLAIHGVGMHQTTVAKLEAGSKPLRLNEVLAIAAYFEVPIESLWEESGDVVSEYEVADLLRETLIADGLLAKANAAFRRSVAQATSATVMANTAGEDRRKAEVRKRFLAARLAELEQRQKAAQPEVEGLGHGEH